MKMIHPGACNNCRIPIYGVPDGKGGWKYYHKPSFRTTPCDNPKRRPEDDRPCTCEWPHYNCHSSVCQCVRHIGQIHWS